MKNELKITKNEPKIKNLIKINDYEKIVLKVTSIKKRFYLPYLLKVWVVLPDQNPQYARLLRKEGRKISIKNGIYKVLVSMHNVSKESKLKLLDKVFQEKYKDGDLYQDVLNRFIKDAIPPSSKDFKSIEYKLILDTLATFLISNHDNSDFLNDTLKRKQQRYELYSYSEDIPYNLIPNLVINNKGLYTKHITNRPRMQVRRWKKSKTYKLNKLINSLDKGYTATWCYVNELNEFNFEGTKYKVEDKLYYKSKYGMYIYDQILVIKENEELNFYNMDIDRIDKKQILVPLQ